MYEFIIFFLLIPINLKSLFFHFFFLKTLIILWASSSILCVPLFMALRFIFCDEVVIWWIPFFCHFTALRSRIWLYCCFESCYRFIVFLFWFIMFSNFLELLFIPVIFLINLFVLRYCSFCGDDVWLSLFLWASFASSMPCFVSFANLSSISS